MLKKIISMIGLIAFLPVVCIAGEVNVKRLNNENWTHIETMNFNVLTNAKEKKALEIVRELEDFNYFLAFSLGYEQRALAEKVPVIVAKNKGLFNSLGIPDSYAGIFIRGVGYAVFVRCDGFMSSSEGGSNWGRTVVLHELVHLFMENSSLVLASPPWYEEGMAEYYSTYIEKKDKVIIGDMSILRNRFYSMLKVNGRFENVDTESLFKTSKTDINVEEKSGNDVFVNKFYARALSVVHYMNADLDRLKLLYQYLYLLKKEFTVDEAFELVFKMTYSELDEEVNRYIRGDSMIGISFRIGKDGVEFPDMEVKRHDITKREALEFLYTKMTMLSNTSLVNWSLDKLNADLEKLYPGLVDNMLQQQLAKNPENISLLKWLGNVYGRMKRYSEAIDIYERVLLLDDSNAFSLNNLAWLLVTVPDMELKDPIRAIELAEKAVSIERSAGYLDTLAEAHYVNGSIQKAIDIIEEAISLKKEDNEYLKKQLEKFMAAREKL